MCSWVEAFNRAKNVLKFNSIILQCPNTNCYITYNKTAGNPDAVLVHGMKEGLSDKKTLKQFRENNKAMFIFQVSKYGKFKRITKWSIFSIGNRFWKNQCLTKIPRALAVWLAYVGNRLVVFHRIPEYRTLWKPNKYEDLKKSNIKYSNTKSPKGAM